MPPSARNQSLFELARVLGILGGLLVSVAGVLEVVSLFSARRFPSLDSLTGILSLGIVLLALGLVAMAGSRYVRVVVWDVVLVIVGALAFSFGGGFPWEWGSVLIVLGGVVGIIGRLA